MLASHPLTFVTIGSKPTDDWYIGDAPGPTERPHLSQAQDASVLRQFRQLLGRDFPGLPVIGPAVSPSREVYLKTQVR